MRLAMAGTTLAAALLLSACSSGGGPSAPSTAVLGPTASSGSSSPAADPTTPAPASSTTPPPGDVATPDVSTTSSATAAALTDYGATLAVWATHHDADERFDPGAMWDPTPGWGPDDANDDKFNDVVVTAGRVVGYDMQVPRPAVAAATAIALATATLPPDATVLWRRQFATCYVVQLSSATLGQVLAPAPLSDPQGQVQLRLRSGSPSATAVAFDPGAVTSVRVRPTIAPTSAAFTGC